MGLKKKIERFFWMANWRRPIDTADNSAGSAEKRGTKKTEWHVGSLSLISVPYRIIGLNFQMLLLAGREWVWKYSRQYGSAPFSSDCWEKKEKHVTDSGGKAPDVFFFLKKNFPEKLMIHCFGIENRLEVDFKKKMTSWEKGPPRSRFINGSRCC